MTRLSHLLIVVFFATLLGCSAQETQKFSIPALKERAAAQNSTEYERIKASYTQMKAKYEKDTNDFGALTKLAEIFVVEARATGDHHYYYPAALTVIDRALMKKPNDFEALVTKGTLLMTFHRFADALDIAQRADRLSSGGNAYVYGLLTDANIELGNYDEAVKMSDKMQALRPDLRSYSRVAYLREIFGDRVGAKKAMKMAGESGMFGMEDKAWAFNEFAKLYQGEGALDTAEFIYKGILEERPTYAYAIAGLASIKLSQGDKQGAIANLVKASQLSPEHTFIEQLASLYLLMGDTASAKTMQEKAMASFALHEKDGWHTDREMAVFLLEQNLDLPEAFIRAKKEYDIRPNNIDALDTYAWALHKNGKSAEAIPMMERALRLKTDNATMYYHAGMIYFGAGDKAKATEFLEKALSRNPYLTPLTLEEAKKTLASLKGAA
jgi:tetratricopeptide (TPR) repeat protein